MAINFYIRKSQNGNVLSDGEKWLFHVNDIEAHFLPAKTNHVQAWQCSHFHCLVQCTKIDCDMVTHIVSIRFANRHCKCQLAMF